jgi:GNAT superfamily N-acetyltransferase
MENGTTPLVTLTRAGLLDLPVIRTLWLAMLEEQRTRPFYPLPHPDDADRITEDLAMVLQAPLFYAVIARDGDKMAGFAAAEQQERRFGSPHIYGYFHGIYVLPAYRKHTVSIRLALSVAAWLQERDLAIVECDNPSGYAPWWKAIPLPFKTAYSRYVGRVEECAAAAMAFARTHAPEVVPEPELPPKPEVDLSLIDSLPEE